MLIYVNTYVCVCVCVCVCICTLFCLYIYIHIHICFLLPRIAIHTYVMYTTYIHISCASLYVNAHSLSVINIIHTNYKCYVYHVYYVHTYQYHVHLYVNTCLSWSLLPRRELGFRLTAVPAPSESAVRSAALQAVTKELQLAARQRLRQKPPPYCGWTKSMSHHLRSPGMV